MPRLPSIMASSVGDEPCIHVLQCTGPRGKTPICSHRASALLLGLIEQSRNQCACDCRRTCSSRQSPAAHNAHCKCYWHCTSDGVKLYRQHSPWAQLCLCATVLNTVHARCRQQQPMKQKSASTRYARQLDIPLPHHLGQHHMPTTSSLSLPDL